MLKFTYTDMRFKVELFQDSTYEVFENINYEENPDECIHEDWESVHQGSLSDCEAYIRLTEGNYL